MARLTKKLFPPHDFGWRLRTAESADVVETKLGDGRREIRLDHAPLPGVTTEMLDWWFQNFDGVARFQGARLPAYHLWHPRDHLSVRPSRNREGRIAPGSRLHIREVFNRDPRFETDVRVVIHRWDRRGIGLHRHILGHRVFELDHVFTDDAAGLLYRSCLRVGAAAGPLAAPINRYLVPRLFGDAAAAAWIRHNVEEVGCFADFLPVLFAGKAIARR
ncbi:MAG: hypothetical protein KF899_15930 [Parvibaculum sp.]|nr:hypothetical protein [Parvibaculum sp.]